LVLFHSLFHFLAWAPFHYLFLCLCLQIVDRSKY
jgi:hypothetical protein